MDMREPDDLWRGRQPKYEALVMRGEDRFALTVRLPSGETIDVPLGRFWLEAPEPPIDYEP